MCSLRTHARTESPHAQTEGPHTQTESPHTRTKKGVYIPSADNTALLLAHSNVISYDDELEAVRFVRVHSCVLLLRQSEVQHVARVVPTLSISSVTRMSVAFTHFTIMTVLEMV